MEINFLIILLCLMCFFFGCLTQVILDVYLFKKLEDVLIECGILEKGEQDGYL